VDRAVVMAAEQDEVVQRGRAAFRPVPYVVSVRPLWTTVAARVDAAAIAHGEGGPDSRWDDPGAPAHVERLAGGVENHTDDRGVARDPPHSVRPQHSSPRRLSGGGTARPCDALPPARLIVVVASTRLLGRLCRISARDAGRRGGGGREPVEGRDADRRGTGQRGEGTTTVRWGRSPETVGSRPWSSPRWHRSASASARR